MHIENSCYTFTLICLLALSLFRPRPGFDLGITGLDLWSWSILTWH